MALMLFFPLLLRTVGLRYLVGTGLIAYGLSCILDSNLSPDAAGPQFVPGQLLRGVGMFLTLIMLNQAATSAVSKEYAIDASGLFNAARNLGGSLGLAAIATLQDQRLTFHTARLEESISANSVIGQTGARTQGLPQIYEAIQAQALVMTYSDLYYILGVAMFVMIPLAFLLTPLPKTKGPLPK